MTSPEEIAFQKAEEKYFEAVALRDRKIFYLSLKRGIPSVEKEIQILRKNVKEAKKEYYKADEELVEMNKRVEESEIKYENWREQEYENSLVFPSEEEYENWERLN